MKIYLIELTFLIPEDNGKCKILFSTQKLFIKSSSTIINNCEYFIIIYKIIVNIISNIKHTTHSDAK